MKIAIYPGSFDPITKGHLDIISRAANLFDEVIVVIMRNHKKQCLFSEQERLAMIKNACKDIKNVVCDIDEGLSVKYAKAHHAQVMIRGIRAVQDYEYELQNASTNMFLDSSIETCFLLAKPEYSFLSSSSVKEIAYYHEEVGRFVDEYVAEKLKEKFK
ncbi:MAG: pantetheine-phosphate adenylyltransferase [Erysipelotrichia bacterium]|nr:pantetheine-phosphate adenylyltransferase [Erysipelotrichia bacterium]NCC54888.1 pantetheine-phosphate adenylyltransferase [Erysipelotrichia bacterium]